MRSVLKNRPYVDITRLERTRLLMDYWGGDWHVSRYHDLIPTIVLPDPEDRHVVAAAIASRVESIVTVNLGDFPAAVLDEYGIKAVHPDDFLPDLLALSPGPFLSAVCAHRSALKNPCKTPTEYLDGLSRVGLSRTAAALTPYIESI